MSGWTSFTQSRAQITIGHLGDLERLMTAVGEVGLSLTEETDGWQLRPADGLAVFPAPFPLPGRYALSVAGRQRSPTC